MLSLIEKRQWLSYLIFKYDKNANYKAEIRNVPNIAHVLYEDKKSGRNYAKPRKKAEDL